MLNYIIWATAVTPKSPIMIFIWPLINAQIESYLGIEASRDFLHLSIWRRCGPCFPFLSVIRIYLLYLKTVLITAGPGVTTKNASRQHVHGKFHVLSPEPNSWRLKSTFCSRNEPKQYINFPASRGSFP